jgi:hypothetical protein
MDQPPTAPNGRRRSPELDRMFLLVLVIGILTGLILATILGLGLISFGYLSVGSSPATCGTQTTICPPTVAFLPVCPTCAAVSAPSEGTATPSPTPVATEAQGGTSTPDYAATATQACSIFRNRFPGTPCPRFKTPTPPPG